MRRTACLLLIFGLAMALSGCASSHVDEAGPAPPQDDTSRLSELLPALPSLPTSDAERQAAAAGFITRVGAEAFHKGGSTTVDGAKLVLEPDALQPSYALYEFSLESTTWEDRVELDIVFISGSEAWLAWSDYGQGAWQFQQLAPGASFIELGPGQWLSPEQQFYFAVLAVAPNSVRISSISLQVVQYEWKIHVVEPAAKSAAALTVLEGKPTVAFLRTDGLVFARATTAAPSSAVNWIKSKIANIDQVSRGSAAMAVIGGEPMVAFVEGNDVHFARATTATPTGPLDWVVMDLEYHGVDCSVHDDVVAIAGRPAFVFFDSEILIPDFSTIGCYYAETEHPTSPQHWTLEVVRTGLHGDYRTPSLINLGGQATFLFREYFSVTLLRDGEITLGDHQFNDSGMALADGSLVVAYGDVAVSKVPIPGSVDDFVTYEGVGGNSYGCVESIADHAGFAAAAEAKGGMLVFWWWKSSIPAPGEWTVFIVEEGVGVVYGISLADLGGMPAVTYRALDTHDIKFARLVES